MNLPSIVNTLAGLGGGNAVAVKAGQQQPSTPFNQLLSREVAQRPPLQANAAPPSPRPAPQQARASEAARPQPPQTHKAETARQNGRTEAAEPPPAAGAPAAQTGDAAQASDAAQAEQPAAEDGAASLADIPGAPQAALMMQLMASATAATATMPAQEAGNAADPAPAAAIGKGGKDAATAGPLDLRASAGMAMQEGDAALAGKAEGQAAPDLRTAFGKAAADAPGQRPAAMQAGMQADAAAPATALATLQAATQAVHAPTAHVDRLTPAVGTPAWDQALGQKIVWMAHGGEQSASLTMNPPDLGPMQVVLSVSNNQATVDFMAAQPEVRQALEAALPRLRDMMSESGIQLGQANVSAGGQQQFAGADGGGRSGGRSTGDHAGAEAPQQLQGVVRIAPDGAVDTFA